MVDKFILEEGIVCKGREYADGSVAYTTTRMDKNEYLDHLDSLITFYQDADDTIRAGMYEDWETIVTAFP